jgi:antitoxin ParD1/3/4
MIKYAPAKVAQEADMGVIERLTITLPTDMAGMVKGAVDEGDYASTSEVIREALRDWKLKRELRSRQLAVLQAEIDHGMENFRAGKVSEFNAAEIVALGKKLRASRIKSSAKKAS